MGGIFARQKEQNGTSAESKMFMWINLAEMGATAGK